MKKNQPRRDPALVPELPQGKGKHNGKAGNPRRKKRVKPGEVQEPEQAKSIQWQRAGNTAKREEAERLYCITKWQPAKIMAHLDVPNSTFWGWVSRGKWTAQRELGVVSTSPKPVVGPDYTRTDAELVPGPLYDATSDLTEPEKMFVLLFARSCNMSHSARIALDMPDASIMACEDAAYSLLARPDIRDAVQKAKKIKWEHALAATPDLVAYNMRIAFANMTEFVSWGTEEILADVDKAAVHHDGKGSFDIEPTRTRNYMLFKQSQDVDGQLVNKVSVGKDGASIELLDKQKAIDWLSKYFEVFPQDNRLADFQARKLELELIKAQAAFAGTTAEQRDASADDFIQALQNQAPRVWEEVGDDADEEDVPGADGGLGQDGGGD